MSDAAIPFLVLRRVLTDEDVSFLKERCRHTLLHEDMPCFSLIDCQESPTFAKIKLAVEAEMNQPVNYLNDFYIYTDKSFRTDWHIDTELFTFENAVNAWVLLSPSLVVDPLGILTRINDSEAMQYHSLKISNGICSFRNFRTGALKLKSLNDVEAEQTHTPEVRLGDILIFDPRRFHRTNVSSPKHAVGIKFVFGKRPGFLSPMQVPALFWPEVASFNEIVSANERWEDVINGIRHMLKTQEGKQRLSAGFYPEKFGMYKEMVKRL